MPVAWTQSVDVVIVDRGRQELVSALTEPKKVLTF